MPVCPFAVVYTCKPILVFFSYQLRRQLPWATLASEHEISSNKVTWSAAEKNAHHIFPYI